MEDQPKDKVEAIYDLRAAAEEKARAEVHADRSGTPEARDALLNATLDLEAKTQDALDVCHECGRPHSGPNADDQYACAGGRAGNVISVDFGAAAHRPKS